MRLWVQGGRLEGWEGGGGEGERRGGGSGDFLGGCVAGGWRWVGGNDTRGF